MCVGNDDVEYPKLGVVLLQLLDWMTTHKATDRASEDVWKMLASLLPAASDLPTFSYIKRMLTKYVDDTIEKIDMCVDGCVAFYDYKHPQLNRPGRMYSRLGHRTKCPVCNEDRYVIVNGKQVPRKIFYYFPSHYFFKDLFKQKDLVQYLYTTQSTDELDSHVRKSNGWKRKVTDNPAMNSDKRNQTLILSTDGVPYFKEKNARSGWPFVLQLGNLPMALRNEIGLSHLIAFAGCEYMSVDKHTNKVVRVKKEHTSLMPIISRITDDLLTLESTGVSCIDYSLPESHPDRLFQLKAILLYVIGDYPAQAKVSGFSHMGCHACHWCNHRAETVWGSTAYFLNNRQHLPIGHHMREETTPPPPLARNERHCINISVKARDHAGYLADHPKHTTGIKDWCPFSLLRFFSIVWDIMPDMMHIIKGIFQSHLLKIWKGEINMKPPRHPDLRTEDSTDGQI